MSKTERLVFDDEGHYIDAPIGADDATIQKMAREKYGQYLFNNIEDKTPSNPYQLSGGMGSPSEESLRNLGLGAQDVTQQMYEGIKPQAGMDAQKYFGQQPEIGNQSLNYRLSQQQESPEEWGRNWGNENGTLPFAKEALIMGAPGAGLAGGALARAGIGQGAGAMNSLIRAATRSGGEGGMQATLGTLFNPESRGKSAKDAGLWGAGGSLVSDIIGSNNPALRAFRRFLPGAVGGGAAYKASDMAQEGSDRNSWVRHGINTLSGVGGMMLGKQAGSIIPRMFGNNDYYARQHGERMMPEGNRGPANGEVSTINPTQYAERNEAFNRLEIPGTIAEKSGAPNQIAHEARMVQNENDVNRLNEWLGERSQATERATERFKDLNYTENLDPILNEMYTQAGQLPVSQNIINNLQNSRFYNRTVARAHADPEFSDLLANANPNTIEYQDIIKQKMDAMINKRIDNKQPVFNMQRQRDAFVNRLDNYVSNLSGTHDKEIYKKARRLGEYKIFRESINNDTPQKLLIKLNNPDKFEEILKATRDCPQLQQMARDLRTVMNSFSELDAEKLAKSLPQNKTITSLGDIGDNIKAYMRKFSNGEFSKQAMNLSLNPNGARELHRLAQKTNPEKIAQEWIKMDSRRRAQKPQEFNLDTKQYQDESKPVYPESDYKEY